MANDMIDLHDWELRGLVQLEDRALARFAFNNMRKILVFDGLFSMVIDEVFAKNIVYDLVRITPDHPKHDEFLRKLKGAIHGGTPYDRDAIHVYALRASVGADGLIACRTVLEGTNAEWLEAAQS